MCIGSLPLLPYLPPLHTLVHVFIPKVLVGWWLLTATVLTTAYRSSLAADLSVLSFPPPVNTFEDLLRLEEQQGWTWGSAGFSGTPYLFFNQSTDPAVQQIHRQMEVRAVVVQGGGGGCEGAG